MTAVVGAPGDRDPSLQPNVLILVVDATVNALSAAQAAGLMYELFRP